MTELEFEILKLQQQYDFAGIRLQYTKDSQRCKELEEEREDLRQEWGEKRKKWDTLNSWRRMGGSIIVQKDQSSAPDALA